MNRFGTSFIDFSAGHERRALRAVVALIILALAGCGGKPDNLMVAAGDIAIPGRRVDLLVATTRSSEGATAGQMFTGERGRGLSFADIAIAVPPDSNRKIGEVQLPDVAPGDPAKSFVTLRADRIEKSEALKRFHARVAATPKRRVLIFVHGYNTRFDDAVFRFAQIVHDAEAPVTPVLFTWPSRGRVIAYTYDRESANYSRDALESVIQAIARDPAVGEVSILAHSMGNWVTLEALRQMAIRNKTFPPKLKNVMLAAPDVDVDVFRRQIAEIETTGYYPPFTLFVSQDDGALAVSNRIWGGTARLGAIDPDKEPYKSELARDHLTVIDLTKVESSDRLGHGKFAQSPEVVQMIGRRLASGQTLTDGKSGIADKLSGVAMGAAGMVGSTAGLIVSAPLAIVDRQSREALSDRVDEIKSDAGDLVPISSGSGGAR